jgi:hypothetical protein
MTLTTEAYYNFIDVKRLDYDYDEPAATLTRSVSDIKVYEQHHTGGVGPKSLSFEHKRKWILQIERYHEWTKKWSDIFYHCFVFADGEVWEGRDLRRTSQGNISNALTVHIPGNNTVTTEPQYQRLWYISSIVSDGDPARIRDHQQRPASTSCSGENGRLTIARLEREAAIVPEDGSFSWVDDVELGHFDLLHDWARDHVKAFRDEYKTPDGKAILGDLSRKAYSPFDAELTLVIIGRVIDMLRAEIAEGSGTAGPAGAPGAKGPAGPAGAPGADGANGEAAQIDDAVEGVLEALKGAVINIALVSPSA